MPFQSLTAPITIGDIDGFPALYPCHGEIVSGDGLFVETGRRDGCVLFLIVDVAGHGIPAAQIVKVLEQQLLADPFYADHQPAVLLTRLNGLMQSVFATSARFVTAIVFLVDGRQGSLTGANASQPVPYIGKPGRGWQPWQLPNGPPLGILLLATGYQESATSLQTGQQLLIFTDGVTEAGAAQRSQFQHGPLASFLAGLPAGLPGDQVVVLLLQALQRHVAASWPQDDTTILCFQRR